MTGRRPACGARANAGLAVLATLAGCATPPAPVAPGTPAVAAPVDVVSAWQQRQRQTAQAAQAAQQWAQALWAWDVVLTLSPDDADAQRHRLDTLQRQQAALATQLTQARAAAARGNADAAQAAYLQALVIDPAATAPADALREAEARRTRQGNARGPRAMTPPAAEALADAPADGQASAPATRRATRRTEPSAPTPQPANAAREHAAMLARQDDDLDAAIAELRGALARASGDDPRRLRADLAELYFQQATRQAQAGQPIAARAALAECLKLSPAHARARALTRQLAGR
ncbi:MAG: hypothetical protein LCH73_00735 [Proteobacteria bacterium]|nr:hypothetical protein [Pseudomonadota bacterium]